MFSAAAYSTSALLAKLLCELLVHLQVLLADGWSLPRKHLLKIGLRDRGREDLQAAARPYTLIDSTEKSWTTNLEETASILAYILPVRRGLGTQAPPLWSAQRLAASIHRASTCHRLS